MTAAMEQGREPKLLDQCLALVAAPRVCPERRLWMALWEVVHAARAQTGLPDPPKALVGEAWAVTSGLMKRHRFMQLLEAAAARQVLEPVHEILSTLKEEDWAHEMDFVQDVPRVLASNGPPRGDELKRTVQITVRVVAGKLLTFDGQPLPHLEDGIGELVVRASMLREQDRDEFSRTELQELLPSGSVLRLRLSARQIPDGRLRNCVFHQLPDSGMDSAFVEVVVEEPLVLTRRGDKPGVLQPARCRVPCMENQAFDSLNAAYTGISRVFEPDRRSYGGNVFLNAYYFDDDKCQWRPLGELRGDVIFEPR